MLHKMYKKSTDLVAAITMCLNFFFGSVSELKTCNAIKNKKKMFYLVAYYTL